MVDVDDDDGSVGLLVRVDADGRGLDALSA